MSWSPLQPPGARPPAGAYSPAIRAGDHIFISGQVPVDVATGALVGEDIVAQTNAVLDRVANLLHAGGASLRDVVSITAYLSDIANWDEFNRVYRERFEPPYPTRTTVGAQLRGFLVEISAIAYVGDGTNQ